MILDITQFCTENTLCPTSLEVGSFCLSKSSKDGNWYRSQVMGTGEGNVTLQHVDIGLQDVVPITDTRLIDKKFAVFPKLALNVVLHDVHSKDINITDEIKWFSQFQDTILKMTVVSCENGKIEAVIFKEGEEVSINDQIYHHFAVIVDETPQLVDETIDSIAETTTQSELISIKDHTQTSDHSVEISGITPLEETIDSDEESTNVTVYPKPQVDPSEKVLCTYVRSADHVSFQLLKHETMLNLITELLVEPPNQVLREDLIKKGQAVIAQSVDDGNWYRAQVESISPTGVRVLFIDFGNRETVPPTNLRDIYDVRFMQPVTCITCKLDNVVNVDEDKCKAWLEENCIDEIFNAEFGGESSDGVRSIVIRFTDKKGIACVNDIVRTQFAPSTSTLVEVKADKIHYVKGTSVEMMKDENNLNWMVLKEGSYEKVICTIVISSKKLGLQLVRFGNKLDKLMSDISNEVDNLSGVRTIDKGAPCVAQFNDLQWYRAKVVDPAEGYATVEFLDYGNYDDVIVEDIRVINPIMLEDPVYCVKCSLHGVEIPEENQDDAIEYLNKTLVEDAPEVMVMVVKSEGGNHDVILLQQGQNINEFLQESYGGMYDSLRGCSVQLFDKVRITIPPTNQLSKFWCLLDDSKDARESLHRDMKVMYDSKEVDVIDQPEIQMSCCVLAKNGNWCRATIESIQDKEISVFMVDFGFNETTEKSNIRILLPEFCKLGVQGFFGSLFDLRPSKNSSEEWTDEAVEYFNNVCTDDVLTATILNCNDNVRSLALTKSNSDTIYELLSNQHFAESNSRNLNNNQST